MENEVTTDSAPAVPQADTNGTHENGASAASAPRRPDVRYASDEEVARASEKVFRVHHRLFEELAK